MSSRANTQGKLLLTVLIYVAPKCHAYENVHVMMGVIMTATGTATIG